MFIREFVHFRTSKIQSTVLNNLEISGDFVSILYITPAMDCSGMLYVHTYIHTYVEYANKTTATFAIFYFYKRAFVLCRSSVRTRKGNLLHVQSRCTE